MSKVIEISDDDDSFYQETIPSEESVVTSDEDGSDELPKVSMKTSRQAVITNLFPNAKPKPKVFTATPKEDTSVVVNEPQKPVFKRMIGGIEVKLPVDPYGSQVALMSQVITAIKKGQNCLLESPTGSGKTLALLCAALAWQKHERDVMFKENTKDLFLHPDNEIAGAELLATPKKTIESPEKFFSKPVYGQKNIYDTVEDDRSGGSGIRQKHIKESPEGESNLVTIHKKRKLNDSEITEDGTPPQSPDKMMDTAETPEKVSLPTIYYGARTHKQLQQVIKEYGRTGYCVEARMSVLSSRDNSCIREYDRSQWSSKNDMCRACIKKIEQSKGGDGQTTNCKYFDNRKCLSFECLPDAFDLRDLVTVGEEMQACPYFAARDMAGKANIVFCPYNYLIDPAIRRNLQITLPGNILVVDEAHNIEDICRDAASFTITRDQIQAAMKELEIAAGYRYSNQYGTNFADSLLKVLSNWDQWFVNQTPLIKQCVVSNGEASYVWDQQHFLQTLHNHNIGQQQYPQFQHDAEIFIKVLREDPQQMVGVTQATGTLVESISTVLGYLFRDSGAFADNFKPVLQREVATRGGNTSWRSASFDKSIERDSLSLRLICLNPAVVFEPLSAARCIILASGTLTPLISLHSELGTKFPQQISRNHVIPKERVWIGTLSTGADGGSLRCASGDTARPSVQDALGDAILRVCALTPHGVLCFLPSYRLMNILMKRWQDTGVWQQLEELKHVFMENKNAKDHDDIMEDYYKYVEGTKGAVLFAVYRGKVSEGMDFKDNQARAVVAVGIPYPNVFDIAVKQKMLFNDRHAKERSLLTGSEWLRVQAYRALNQAVGRCVRHRGDWGAVLLVDARYREPYNTHHLSGWAKNMLGNNHHTHASLADGPNSLEAFMKRMSLEQKENRKT
ncbi:Fanconi anemia group J protein homolog isoform X2 [Aricia agestis]|uniref:Fanconi anemia group J protein homolog isoform X2 n=1 Tax=Aricia agestis TaxID=91739 RepID=UPI001C20885C|nr:Fanconi anemia group J protein homolog isoform X2 [Aricia agestis]